MIKAMLICDSAGYAFYSKNVNEKFQTMDPVLLSGLISAIGSLGKVLFKEEIANIAYGNSAKKKNIVVITQELFGIEKVIYFVFLTKGDIDYDLIRKLRSAIYIETKHDLKNTNALKDVKGLHNKIDRIINSIDSEIFN
ncbi:MAG: hypothetical protein JW891_02550 [Candidatus Lokiarchaeota archaeon]|nr:hypothetical protein [Candidatus Lokiarchaeota archaeon]